VIANVEDAAQHDRYPVLFDPQTAGGLLAGVPASEARQCLEDLKQLGYAQAAIIGVVKPGVEEFDVKEFLVRCRGEGAS
jgi:selenide,water dikinase